jgi:hypothetical protein
MNLIQTFFPTPVDLKQYGLVMPDHVRASLIAKQDAANITQHRIAPVALSDGRYAINADVLTEAHVTGLFNGVNLFDSDAVDEIEILSWSAILDLLPKHSETDEGEFV